MPTFPLVGTASSGEEETSIVFYVILVVVLVAVTFFMRKVLSRRADKKVVDAAGDAPSGLAVRIAPAPPFPDDVARVRVLLGDSSPPPRITRYSVPVMAVVDGALQITDKTVGTILTIPAASIVSITAAVTPITPKGTFVARKYPSLVVTVAHRDVTETIALTPLRGTYDKVPLEVVEGMADELTAGIHSMKL